MELIMGDRAVSQSLFLWWLIASCSTSLKKPTYSSLCRSIRVFLPSSFLKEIMMGWFHILFFNHYLIIHEFIYSFQIFSTSNPESNWACPTSMSNTVFSPDMLLPCGPLAIGRCHHLPSWPNHASVSYHWPLNFSYLPFIPLNAIFLEKTPGLGCSVIH